MPAARGARQHRSVAEQYEQWTAHLRRHAVSRRSVSEPPVGSGPGGSGGGPAGGG